MSSMADDNVPRPESKRMKTQYIQRTNNLSKRNQELTSALHRLIKIHHSTITGSKLHNPNVQPWGACECLTCKYVASLLPEQAEASKEAKSVH